VETRFETEMKESPGETSIAGSNAMAQLCTIFKKSGGCKRHSQGSETRARSLLEKTSRSRNSWQGRTKLSRLRFACLEALGTLLRRGGKQHAPPLQAERARCGDSRAEARDWDLILGISRPAARSTFYACCLRFFRR